MKYLRKLKITLLNRLGYSRTFVKYQREVLSYLSTPEENPITKLVSLYCYPQVLLMKSNVLNEKYFFLIGRNFEAYRDRTRVTAKTQYGKNKAKRMQFFIVFKSYFKS